MALVHIVQHGEKERAPGGAVTVVDGLEVVQIASVTHLDGPESGHRR
ncbi:hypothetical protein [Glycomyces salinus]|nr:hypothetical protein [Glycomyces salinus]